MGLSVRLETELGEPVDELVGDPTNILHRILRPYYDDQTAQCLRFIDWYGSTFFNYLQMEPFLREWQKLYSVTISNEEKELLSRIEKLARRCQAERLLLRFIGD